MRQYLDHSVLQEWEPGPSLTQNESFSAWYFSLDFFKLYFLQRLDEIAKVIGNGPGSFCQALPGELACQLCPFKCQVTWTRSSYFEVIRQHPKILPSLQLAFQRKLSLKHLVLVNHKSSWLESRLNCFYLRLWLRVSFIKHSRTKPTEILSDGSFVHQNHD